MKRQIIATLTLGSFIIVSLSNYSIKPIKPDMLIYREAGDIDILRLKKASGELIIFSESQPGRVEGHFIRGVGARESSVAIMEINKAEVKSISRQGDRSLLVVKQDDTTYYNVQKIVEKLETIEIWVLKDVQRYQYEAVSVDLSEVEMAWGMTMDNLKTAIVTLVPIAILVTAGIFVGAALAQC